MSHGSERSVYLQWKAGQSRFSCPLVGALGTEAWWLCWWGGSRKGKGQGAPCTFPLSGRVGSRLCQRERRGRFHFPLPVLVLPGFPVLRYGPGEQSIVSYWCGNQPRSSLTFQAIWVKNKLSESRLAIDVLVLVKSACDKITEERQMKPPSHAALLCIVKCLPHHLPGHFNTLKAYGLFELHVYWILSIFLCNSRGKV